MAMSIAVYVRKIKAWKKLFTNKEFVKLLLGTCGIRTHGCKALQASALDRSAKVPWSLLYEIYANFARINLGSKGKANFLTF